jgi:hypothetical protein
MLTETFRTLLQWKPTELTVRKQLAVFALYLILAIAYTYPLAFNLSTHIPDKHPTIELMSDASLQTWYPWWVRKALLSSEESVLHSNWVYYPAGMEMTMQPAMFLHGAMTVPLYWLNITTANNTVIIISFALSGLAAFLLGLYVSGSVPGALLCGFVYAFSPYKLHHIEGHIQLMATETLPLVALSLIRLLDRPSRKHIIWAGVWLGITVYTDYYYFAYALLLYGFIALYRLAIDTDRLAVLRHTVIAGLVALVVAGPLLIPALVSAAQSDYALATGHEKHKADLLSPIIPSQRQWLTQPLIPFLSQFIDMEHVDGIEHSVYVGWPLLILCLVYRKQIWRNRGNPLLFLLVTAAFLILALGPFLGVNGYTAVGESRWRLPLPGFILMKLPVFEGARAPSRIFIIAIMGLAVWGACALRQLLTERTVRGVRAEFVAAGIAAFTMLEYIVPLGMSEIQKPSWVATVAADPDPGIIVELPLMPQKPAFWQTLTERKVLMANLGRTDQDLNAYYWRHVALQFLVLPHYATRMPEQADARYLIDLLGIRYVVVDLTAYKQPRIDRIVTVLEKVYGLKAVQRDEKSILYRHNGEHRSLEGLKFKSADRNADLHLPLGWSNRKPFEGELVTWMTRERAVIALPPIKPGNFNLNLSLRILAKSRVGFRVEVNGFDVGPFSASPGIANMSIPMDGIYLSTTQTNQITLFPTMDLSFPHETGMGTNPSAHGIPVEVTSGGFFTDSVGSAEIRVGGQKATTAKRGLLVAIIDSTGRTDAELFESLEDEHGVDSLEAYILAAPESATIAVACRTINFLGGDLARAMRWLGLPAQFELNALNSFALIGGKDGRTPILDTGATVARIGTSDVMQRGDTAVGLRSLELVRR